MAEREQCHVCEGKPAQPYAAVCGVCRAALSRPQVRELNTAWRQYAAVGVQDHEVLHTAWRRYDNALTSCVSTVSGAPAAR